MLIAASGHCSARLSCWAAFFPLMFLLFAVAMGEFLIPAADGVTARFHRGDAAGHRHSVYREGHVFQHPSGDWSVVEGCSGLRYLIASVTLGVLYAYLTYRSWQRRLLFSLAAIVVPIFANSGRAYLIVMIAHLSDMKLALGVDHYIYGWVFFGLVMLLLFWNRQFSGAKTTSPSPLPRPGLAPPAGGAAAHPLLPVAIAVLAVAGLWPLTPALDARALPAMPALQVEAQGGWQPGEDFTGWTPHWIGADRQLRHAYTQAGRNVLLELNYYVTQRQDAELINSQNFMIRQKDPLWSNVGETLATVQIGGMARQVRQARLRGSNGQRLLVWQWNLIGRHATVNDQLAKLSWPSTGCC